MQTVKETDMSKLEDKVQADYSDAWQYRNRNSALLGGVQPDAAALGLQGLGDVEQISKRDAMGRPVKKAEDSDSLPGMKL
jgi:hypothetical protein